MYTIEPHHDHKSLADTDKFLFSLSRFMALFSLFFRFRAPEVKEEVRAQVDGSSRQWGGKEGGKEKETKNNRWWLFGGVRKENLLLLRLLVKNLFSFRIFLFPFGNQQTKMADRHLFSSSTASFRLSTTTCYAFKKRVLLLPAWFVSNLKEEKAHTHLYILGHHHQHRVSKR